MAVRARWGRGCALLTMLLDPGDVTLRHASAQVPERCRYLKVSRVCFLSLKAKGSCCLVLQPVVKGTFEKKHSVENGAWLRTGNCGGGGMARPSFQRVSESRASGGLLPAPGAHEVPLASLLWDLSNWPWRRITKEQSSEVPRKQAAVLNFQ